MESSRTRRPLAALTALCSVALLATLAWPLLTRRVFVFDDLSWFHLPLRYLYQQALQAGDTVLWTPSIFAGFYLHGEGQLGAFHPLHQLLYRLLPLDIAFNLELLASYVAAFAGMVWFLRRLDLSRAAALVGAMLFAFSGFMLLHHHHLNVVAVVAHMPWLLAGADVVIVEERGSSVEARLRSWPRGQPRFGVPAGVSTGGLVGCAGARRVRALPRRRDATLARTARLRCRRDDWRPARRRSSCCRRPTPSRTRCAPNVSRDFAMTYSLHPANLLQLWSPRVFTDGAYSDRETMLFHEFGIYSGALLPVALCWMWSRRRRCRARRGLIAAATVLTVLGVWLALGRYGGLAGLLAQLPVLQSLRAPVRYIVLAQFAAAVLAALTIDDLLAIGEGEADVGSAFGRGLDSAGAQRRHAPDGQHGIPVRRALRLRRRRGRGARCRARRGGLAARRAGRTPCPLGAPRPRAGDDGRSGDVGSCASSTRNRHARLPRSRTPLPAAPPEIEDCVRRGDRQRPLPIQPARVARLSPDVGVCRTLPGDEASKLGGRRGAAIVRHATGASRPTGRATRFVGAVDRVRLLDRERTDAAGAVRMAIDRPGRLVAHVEAPGPRILAFTERFHSGWSATIDGRRAANGAGGRRLPRLPARRRRSSRRAALHAPQLRVRIDRLCLAGTVALVVVLLASRVWQTSQRNASD